MTAWDGLGDNVAELVGTERRPGLMARLLAPDSHLVGGTDTTGRRTPPGSRLPVRAHLLDLEREIGIDAMEWNVHLGGHARRVPNALAQLPMLAEGLDPNDERLHGRDGLFATVAGWVRQCQVALGLVEPAPTRYPETVCSECGERALVGRPHLDLLWCANCGERYTRFGYAEVIAQAQRLQESAQHSH